MGQAAAVETPRTVRATGQATGQATGPATREARATKQAS